MTKVTLINRAKIDLDEEYLNRFISYTNPSDGNIVLVLHDNSLPENNQGVCCPSQLKEFASEYLDIDPFLRSNRWDCLVAIANKWCIKWDVYPAYFTYLLGHEFGHAHICISDIALHIHCCLVHDWIKAASRNEIQFQRFLPNEQLFDQYGKFLSIQMHGDEKLNFEIDSIKKGIGVNDLERLKSIKELAPKHELDGLRDLLVTFSLPYKEELIKCWQMDVQQNGSESLASYINNYDELFEY